MDNIELNKCLKNNSTTACYFKGVFSWDNKPSITQYPHFYIVNTQTSKNPGEHWLVIFVLNSFTVEIFDSLALLNSRFSYIYKYFKATFTNVLFNNQRLQPLETSTCGIHCLYYAYQKCKFKQNLNIVIRRIYIQDPYYNDCKALKTVKKHFPISTKTLKNIIDRN